MRKNSMNEVGRLAFRHEGEFWNAYWSPSQSSMDGAIHLGSLRMNIARVPALKEAFMSLMRGAFEEGVKDSIGAEVVTTWGKPHPAPESERGGNA
jgi:hypothetical protein